MALYNQENRDLLKAKMAADPTPRKTLSFYRYAQIEDPQAFRDALFLAWDQLGVKGRTYVASEGINAQVTVPEASWEAFCQQLDSIPWLRGVRLNLAVEHDPRAFYKLKIKVRPKIVADGLEDASFDVTRRGQHLDAPSFNDLLSRPDTVVVDMRNHYESEVGHFEGAICPDVDTFRDSLPVVEEILAPHRDKHIVMYCTGGIRCEKASAWFKHRGFDHVYQLDGGIIQYAREVEAKGLPNKFKGKNFVFDERLGERISPEVIAHCHQCGAPSDTHTNCQNDTCNLLFIQCEACAEKYEGCCGEECQEIIHLPEAERYQLRKGTHPDRQAFSKGRYFRAPEKSTAPQRP